MPHSSEDPPSDPISSETPGARPAEDPGSEPTRPSHLNPSAEDASNESDPQGRTEESSETPRLPLRRRRRRRPPRTADPAGASAAPQGPAEHSATAEDASLSGDLPATPPPEGQPRRRRRHRRGPRRDEGSAEVTAGGAAQSAESTSESSPNSPRERWRTATAGRTNSHAADVAAPGLRAQRKRAQPTLINSFLVQSLKALRREHRSRVQRHPGARRAVARATAVAATNGRRREDRQDTTGARWTAPHAAGAHQVATSDGREETATRRPRDHSRGYMPSNRWSIAALRM